MEGRVIFNEQGLVVAPAQSSMGGQTLAMQAVTSVSVRRKRRAIWTGLFVMLGGLALAGGAQQASAFAALAATALGVLVGLAIWTRPGAALERDGESAACAPAAAADGSDGSAWGVARPEGDPGSRAASVHDINARATTAKMNFVRRTDTTGYRAASEEHLGINFFASSDVLIDAGKRLEGGGKTSRLLTVRSGSDIDAAAVARWLKAAAPR